MLVFHGSLYNVPVYKIAVCDDDKETAAQLERYLSDIAAGLRIPSALDMELSDIAVILGNLLDNALDAVPRSADKTLKLDIRYDRQALFIHIENTYDGIVTCDSGGRLKSRKPSAGPGDHGHGLKNIRRAAEKYNGYVDIAHDGTVFSVTVLLYVKG